MIIIFDENFISQNKIFSYLTGRIEKLNIKLLIGKQEYRDNITVKKFKRMTKSIAKHLKSWMINGQVNYRANVEFKKEWKKI